MKIKFLANKEYKGKKSKVVPALNIQALCHEGIWGMEV
jgi:hypothetical protein